MKSASAEAGYETLSIAYPTGDRSTSALLIEKIYPRVVILNNIYKYVIHVTNLTDLSLKNVTLSEVIPDGFQLAEANPNYSKKSGQEVIWALGTLSPNETRTIELTGKAGSKNDLPCCTSADYDIPSFCSTTSVVQPAISIDLDAPSSVTVCEEIPLTITVKNVGDSYLGNVEVTSNLPSGVSSLGKDKINIRAGSLNADESKRYVVRVKPQQTGSFRFQATAQANGVSDESSTQTTNVGQPELTISARSSRDEIYIGRPIDFTINVKNVSSEEAVSTVVKALVSGNLNLKSVSDNGQASGRGIVWDVGTLGKNASKNLSFTAVGIDSGKAEVQAEARAICAEAAVAKSSASIEGIPALLLEVIDIDDPIELGNQETYIITVTNQGTATAKNIDVVAILDGMEYVSDTGDTKASVSGNKVDFATLPRLGAHRVAQWKLTTKGTKTGDLRFKIIMNSDDLTTTVEETESTFVY